MSKVLFLPLLQLPSGHHQVADAVARWIRLKRPEVETEKHDVLYHFNRLLEKMVSTTYVKWIHYSPQSYNWVYRLLAYQEKGIKKSSHKGYEILFLTSLFNIIQRSKPDLIICTHSLPSYLAGRLKKMGKIDVPIINIYTDFFINRVWGLDGVDLHFVPSRQVKEQLINYGIEENKIYITGIPVDHVFYSSSKADAPQKYNHDGNWHVLISGGSIGVGMEQRFIDRLQQENGITYTILCGRNTRLYHMMLNLDDERIRPLPYIQNREEMKQIYDQVDCLITKPGGVTVSEAIQSQLPIFIHAALPGQEEINKDFLCKMGLVHCLELSKPIVEQLREKLRKENMIEWQKRVELYCSQLQWHEGLAALFRYL